MTKKHGRARRWAITGLAVVTATAGLVVGGAVPAFADPTTTLVGVGSDTTQDVMDGIANNIGAGAVGSWDAVNPATQIAHEGIAPKAGCTETRPNGSGEGLNALRKSLNPATTAAQLADPPEAGCVDFARSSSGPATADASPNGALVYIPFALDAVAGATGPATAVTGSDPAVATNITNADLFTLQNVKDMYDTCSTVLVNGVNYVPDGTVTDATHQPIHLYYPQVGSGTSKFWATTIGFNQTSPPLCVHNTIEGTNPPVSVEEHNGTVFAQDADAYGPFSIAQWIAQKNGHNDRRHNAVLHSLNGVTPLTGTGKLNTAYPIIREVYNIVSFARVTSNAPADAQFVAIFNGAGSTVCSQSITIQQFGFALLNSAPLGHTCGQVASDLRAFDPATDPV
jgi:hypothetical protein